MGNPKGFREIFDLNFTEQEVNEIYAPIIQKLLSGHKRSLKARTGTLQPLLIGITGSVSVGKSTISNIIKKLAINPPKTFQLRSSQPITFSFLIRNSQKNQILHRKGFPESFDHAAIIEFLSEISEGKPNSIIPIYSHETYDIDGTSRYEVTDLIIIEGVNILQNPLEKNDRGPSIREFLDFSIFIDADESEIAQWYEGRFLKYCSLAEGQYKVFLFAI
ncbi:MAG: hypothetical protein Ct9H90mP11_07960 [Acidimicrobiales bacterium]|nr:MAG: hypothetical protein Ct9H90mP11_07960 [Acidimicrobiales bacterium]